MAKSSWSDELDVIGYLFGFWLFILSKNFRKVWLGEFNKASLASKLMAIFEASISVLVGFVLPVFLIYSLLR